MYNYKIYKYINNFMIRILFGLFLKNIYIVLFFNIIEYYYYIYYNLLFGIYLFFYSKDKFYYN